MNPPAEAPSAAEVGTVITRGEVWLIALGKGRAGEPDKHRPGVVVSIDRIQSGTMYDLITVVPLTTSRVATALRPTVAAGRGLAKESVAVCDAVRAVARSRFLRRLGEVDPATMQAISESRATIEGWDD